MQRLEEEKRRTFHFHVTFEEEETVKPKRRSQWQKQSVESQAEGVRQRAPRKSIYVRQRGSIFGCVCR